MQIWKLCNLSECFNTAGVLHSCTQAMQRSSMSYGHQSYSVHFPFRHSSSFSVASSLSSSPVCIVFDGVMSPTCLVKARAADLCSIKRLWLQLLKMPKGWSFVQGAAFLVQSLTAYYGLKNLGNIKAWPFHPLTSVHMAIVTQ